MPTLHIEITVNNKEEVIDINPILESSNSQENTKSEDESKCTSDSSISNNRE